MLLGLAALIGVSCTQKLTLNDYTIILPQSPTEIETLAASELQRYLKAISGNELAIVSDTAAEETRNLDRKYQPSPLRPAGFFGRRRLRHPYPGTETGHSGR